MASMSADPHARPLGRIERFYWLLDQHACTNFVLAAQLGPGLPRQDRLGGGDRLRFASRHVRARL